MRKLYLSLVTILFISILLQQTVLNGTIVALYGRFVILGFIIVLFYKLLLKYTFMAFRASIFYITIIIAYGLFLFGLGNYDILGLFFYIAIAILFMSIGSILANYKLENRFYKYLLIFFIINLFITIITYLFHIDFSNQRIMNNRFSGIYYSSTYCALALSMGAIYFVYRKEKIFSILTLVYMFFVFLTVTIIVFVLTLIIILNKLIVAKKIYKFFVIFFISVLFMSFGDILIALFLSRGQEVGSSDTSSIEGRWLIVEYTSNLLKNNLDILLWGSTYLTELEKILPISPDEYDRNIYWHNPFALLFMGGLVIYIVYHLFLIKNIRLNSKLVSIDEKYTGILAILILIFLESFLEPTMILGTFTHFLFFVIYGVALKNRGEYK